MKLTIQVTGSRFANASSDQVSTRAVEFDGTESQVLDRTERIKREIAGLVGDSRYLADRRNPDGSEPHDWPLVRLLHDGAQVHVQRTTLDKAAALCGVRPDEF